MKKHQSLTNLPAVLLALGISLAAASAPAQHINAGAASQNPGAQLQFINSGATFLSPGFQQLTNIVTLNYSNSGTYAGLFTRLNGPSFTALANSNSPFAAALGSFLDLSIVSVAGPVGGSFYFYDVGATTPTYTLGVGGTATTDLFTLSEGTADPYGHIHGRRFGVDLPGTYTVGFQILDVSHNGPGGGPIHAPSDVYYLTYKTNPVPEPSVATLAFALAAAGFAGMRSGRNRLK